MMTMNPTNGSRRRHDLLAVCCQIFLLLSFHTTASNAQTTCFQTKQELSDAITAYVADPNVTSQVAGTYGHPIGTWCVSQITDFSGLFADQATFNEDLLGWDTSAVTNMEDCFARCLSFYGQMQTWDVSQVTSFQGMFRQARRFTGDLSQWDTSSAQDLSFMFYDATSIQTDLSNWNVAKVTTFESFASAAGILNTDISGWDISRGENFRDMFGRGAAMDRDLCVWGQKMNRNAIVENIFGSRDFTASNCPDPFDPDFDQRPPGPFCHSCGGTATPVPTTPPEEEETTTIISNDGSTHEDPSAWAGNENNNNNNESSGTPTIQLGSSRFGAMVLGMALVVAVVSIY